jgi:transposase
VLYSIRSERQLVEQIEYNLLFRWFAGLGMDDAIWHRALFSKNRDRLLRSALPQQFLSEVTGRPRVS